MASQLAAVVGGADVRQLSDKAAKAALADAAGVIARQKRTVATMKENASAAATEAVAALEMHGAAFMASMASGFRGEKALKIGPVDARLIGVPLIGWGFYELLMGRGGSHQLALGNGLLVSLNVEQALLLGNQVREMRAGNGTQIPGGGPAPMQISPTTDPATEGVDREVLLHPAADGRRPAPRHRPGPRRQMAR